jgi:glutathione S-transferase
VITLYHCSFARSFRPLWTLEELGLGYELKMLPFPPRVLAPDYLQINPLGTIPLLLDGETRMTESAAICQYLVTHYGPSLLAVAPQESAHGAYLNWLHFGEATLTFPQTIVLRYSRLEPEERRNPQVVEDYTRWFLARLRAIDAALLGQPYVCAGRLRRPTFLSASR